MDTNLYAGKLSPNSNKYHQVIALLKKEGVEIDNSRPTIYSLTEAKAFLSNYQAEFRNLFSRQLDTSDLDEIEQQEEDLISNLWLFWHFYANNPYQTWANPKTQIPNRIRTLRNDFDARLQLAVNEVEDENTSISKLSFTEKWDGDATLWLRLDIKQPIELYAKFEQFITAMRVSFHGIEFNTFEYDLLVDQWEYIAVIPVINGKLRNDFAWKLHILTTILSDKRIDELVFSFAPRQFPSLVWKELGFSFWDTGEFIQANELVASVSALSILAVQLGDLRNLPNEVIEGGNEIIQQYVENQMGQINQFVQTAFDIMAKLARTFNELTEDEQRSREFLLEAVNGLLELQPLIKPSKDHDGETVFTIEEFHKYAQRLEQARTIAELTSQYWISDAIAQVEN
jgi:hypothetical protein